MGDLIFDQSQRGVGALIVLDAALCIGCNTCVEVCRQHIFLPDTEQKKSPPSLVNIEECWFCGVCALSCPVPGALKLIHPLMQRVGWKRKESGEYYRIGMKNPPPLNTREPIDWKKKDISAYRSGRDAVTIFDDER